ncbi:MAG: hypothetical protein KW802_00540 [Candidatus Doudnabacteria bacterium]|nr:hypothetical protein [Candidatus Doudnabacteria bacterium]
MAYSKILKQAYEITRDNKFLWIFGLFLSLITVGLYVIGWLQENSKNGGYLFLLFTLSVIVSPILVIRIKTAIIIAVKAVVDKQETNAAKAFMTARFFYWRAIGVYLLVQMSILILLSVGVGPVMYLNHQGQNNSAIVLGVLAAVFLLPVVVTAVVVNILAPMFIVVYDQKVNEAINKTYPLISKHLGSIFAFAVLNFLVSSITLFFSQFVLKLGSGMPLLIHVLIGIVYVGIETFAVIFMQTAWVLLFLDLIRPQKLEEAEPVVAPEIVS